MTKRLLSAFTGKEWNGRKVESFPLSLVWPSVPRADKLKGKPFYSTVKDDISQNGLKFPIIVVKCTYEELLEQKKKFNKSMRQPPSRDTFFGYVVWGGSNRYRIAEELGYNHIDCVIYDNFDEARKDQALHREPYQHLYR